MVVVSYCQGHPQLVLANRLGLSLSRNSATINCPALHGLVVDWAVKLQYKQNETLWESQVIMSGIYKFLDGCSN